jgi:hypothetical protein
MNLVQPSSGECEVLGVNSRRLEAIDFMKIGYVSESQTVRCMAPLRDPALIITIDNAVLFHPSYSPFPADLSIQPLHVGERFLSNYRPTDVRYLNVKRLAGHARKDFRFEDVQLADYVWP